MDRINVEGLKILGEARERLRLVPCIRTKFYAIIVQAGRLKIHGYNHGPLATFGLCGAGKCLRQTMKIDQGDRLEVSCIHAEMDALMKYLSAGHSAYLGLPFDLYLYGSGGASLPCINCFKHLIVAGCKRMFIAGADDKEYVSDETSVPAAWLAALEHWEYVSNRDIDLVM